MPKNKKQAPTLVENFTELSKQAGLLLMTGLVTLGLLDLPSQPDKRVVLPSRPSLAFAENNYEELNNPIRREREELAPHYISYSVVQRTAPRSGKR